MLTTHKIIVCLLMSLSGAIIATLLLYPSGTIIDHMDTVFFGALVGYVYQCPSIFNTSWRQVLNEKPKR